MNGFSSKWLKLGTPKPEAPQTRTILCFSLALSLALFFFCLALKSSLSPYSSSCSHYPAALTFRGSFLSSSMADGAEVVHLHSPITAKHENPSKFYSHFIYKAVIVAIFLVILPLFPSEAPEFVNQTIITRGWELLHLLFVGIAVSYGLFSRRTDETEKENHSKFDNAQSYVSKFLQVSSVFDDEAETPSGSNENKIQTWSSQYYRGEPVVVVAQESFALDEQRGTSSRIREKPLLLPVRSLKSRVSEAGVVGHVSDSVSISASISRSSSNVGTKRFSNNTVKTRNKEYEGLDHVDLGETLGDNFVLRSPIPWRSRSGRMEMKEELDSPSHYSLPPSMVESEFTPIESRSFRSQMYHSSPPNSASASPKNLSPSSSISSQKKLSPLPSLSLESQGKNVEDFSRKKVYYMSSPPPAPPPPPPINHKSRLVKSNSSSGNGATSFEKDLRRSILSEAKDLKNGRDELLSRSSSEKEAKPRTLIDGSLIGKSVRTVWPVEPVAMMRRGQEIDEDGMDSKMEKKSREVEAALLEKIGTVRFDPRSIRPEKPSHEIPNLLSKPSFSELQKQERELADNFKLESDEDSSENDEDVNCLESDNEEAASSSVSDGGPDVNKKADEFIAKFREQIRLQRIESIKRSSGQLKRNSLR